MDKMSLKWKNKSFYKIKYHIKMKVVSSYIISGKGTRDSSPSIHLYIFIIYRNREEKKELRMSPVNSAS